MKVGSKLALYKLKLEYDGEKGKIYKATAVENFSVKTSYGNTFEQHFINNIIIYTNLELEIANFDIDLPPKLYKKRDGSTYEFKQPTLSFERISNPKKSIIRVLDFEYKIFNCRDKYNKIKYNANTKNPMEVSNWIIYDCEYDYPNWKFPENDIQQELAEYKKKNIRLEQKILKLENKIQEYKELKSKSHKSNPKKLFVDSNGKKIELPTFDDEELI